MILTRDSFIIQCVCCVVLMCATVGGNAQNTTTPSQNDRRFVRSALEGGEAEVRLGQIAREKSNRMDVKQFGQKMIDDHTKLAERMRDVAIKEGIQTPSRMSARDKVLEAKLKKLSGTEFDRAYIRAMVKDQRDNLQSFNREATKGNDTEIKDLASQGAELIKEHLKLAEQLAQWPTGDQGF